LIKCPSVSSASPTVAKKPAAFLCEHAVLTGHDQKVANGTSGRVIAQRRGGFEAAQVGRGMEGHGKGCRRLLCDGRVDCAGILFGSGMAGP
jgi:hypothetical protein